MAQLALRLCPPAWKTAWKMLKKGMPQDLEDIIQFMELQESAEKSTTAKAKAHNNNGSQNGGNQAGSNKRKVTLVRMEEVPRRLRNTVHSVRNMVALQTPMTPMIAVSTRQTVVRRDSLVERRSRTMPSCSLRRSLRKPRRSWTICLRKWIDLLSRGPRRNLKAVLSGVLTVVFWSKTRCRKLEVFSRPLVRSKMAGFGASLNLTSPL